MGLGSWNVGDEGLCSVQYSAVPVAPDGEAGAVHYLQHRVHPLFPFIPAYHN